MARTNDDFRVTLPEFQCEAPLKIVIAYEDTEAGRHARNVCNALTEHLGPNSEMTSEMWRFDVLRIPECRELAGHGAAQADIIMISTHGEGHLPGDVKAWIEMWLRDKDGLVALVALCDRPQSARGEDWPIRSYLAGVAQRGQVEFFAEPDVWPGRGPYQEHFALDNRAEGIPGMPLPTVAAGTTDMSFSHWGLNE